MEITVCDQLSALSHPNRLAIFRLLMRRYPDAVPAGEIANALTLKANTTSVYLAVLNRAGIILQTRVGTSLKYQVDLDHVRGLFGSLLSDCCQNRPDLCVDTDCGATDTKIATGVALNILFVCTGNSARSIIAEAILRSVAKNRFNAFSAGMVPASQPHPKVMDLLSKKTPDITHLTSKSLRAFQTDDAPAMDIVITVCDRAANESSILMPNQPLSAHWGLPNPVLSGSTSDQTDNQRLENVYETLLDRITAFADLPFKNLGRIGLQHELDRIGARPEKFACN